VELALRYVELGLRLGRHVDGLVDAYFGPAEMATRVDREDLRPPEALADDAAALRRELQEDDELAPRRRAWLDDQLLGVETFARRLAGEPLAYADEVERCFGLRPPRTPEDVFAAALDRLDEALPGEGDLVTRYADWRAAQVVPPEAMLDVFSALRERFRAATAALLGLPPDEDVETELVRDEPWLAYNYYLGGRRSRIAINVDLPIAAPELVDLVAHEAYPGHHTEHAWKEQLLVDAGVVEESLVLIPTPQSMVSEGIAEIAWELVDRVTRDDVAAVLADAGVEAFDPERTNAVEEARRPLRFVGLNAALLLHEDGASEKEAVAYVERWSARTREYAQSSVRFLLDPLWRAYAATYSLGGDLARRHVQGSPERFRALLTEQTRVADMLPVSSGP
jgi:hypothetical protein